MNAAYSICFYCYISGEETICIEHLIGPKSILKHKSNSKSVNVKCIYVKVNFVIF